MTPQALQRFVVRMLWDPTLVERVYAGQRVEGLDAEGRAHLTRVDRRAWDTDPYRRARTLQALVEEHPCSVGEVGVAGLDAFFADRAFHDAIQGRGSLAGAFGAWLAPRAGPVAAIERALVSARRDRAAPAVAATTPGELVRAPGVRSVEVPAGTCARWELLRSALGPDPVARLTAGYRAPPRPPRGSGVDHVLVTVGGAGESVALGSEGVHALLLAAERPVPRARLLKVAGRLGATPEEASEILDELLAEGLLAAS